MMVVFGTRLCCAWACDPKADRTRDSQCSQGVTGRRPDMVTGDVSARGRCGERLPRATVASVRKRASVRTSSRLKKKVWHIAPIRSMNANRKPQNGLVSISNRQTASRHPRATGFVCLALCCVQLLLVQGCCVLKASTAFVGKKSSLMGIKTGTVAGEATFAICGARGTASRYPRATDIPVGRIAVAPAGGTRVTTKRWA